jgi:hypothetical protein
MSFPVTPIEVKPFRDYLARLLDSDLGTFANGVKAIWVEPPDPPKDGKGLHCFIYYRPRQLRPSTGLHQSIQQLAWQVALRQVSRDVAAIEQLAIAGDKIRNGFSGCVEGASTSVADRMPMLTFSIPFTKIVNPASITM